jgi:hypothetical protein
MGTFVLTTIFVAPLALALLAAPAAAGFELMGGAR